MFSTHGTKPLLLLILLWIGASPPADGAEQMVTGVNATASMYDNRTSLNEGSGCYDTGCLPRYTLDGLLNDEAESRWSCAEHINSTIGVCYITFDLHDSYTLTELIIFFHKSDDLERDPNPFEISISADNVMYEFSFSGNNTLGTPLGTGENFSFPEGSSGQYVRLTGILEEDQWLSINEVETYVYVGVPSSLAVEPTSAPTSFMPTASSTALLSSTVVPTLAPTPLGTMIVCANVTVSNVGDLNGLYVWGPGDTFFSTGVRNATIESSQISIECANTSLTSCSVTKWTIADEQNLLLAYMAFDDAVHPALITQVWLRENCSNADCNSAPANVEIVCGDTSTSGTQSFTPTPVPVTSTECDTVEVEGTSGGTLDGIYYNDGSSRQGGVAQFMGYDSNSGNGNALAAEWVTGGCPSPSGNTTIINGDCTWRKWSITPDSDNVEAFEHFTYDEADHPVDIASEILWYILDTIEKPYDGTINITCAPEDTLTWSTPSPTPAQANTSSPTEAPAIQPSTPIPSATSDDDSGGDTDITSAIIGGMAGVAVVLVLSGLLVYRRLNTPTPLPLPPRAPSYSESVAAVADRS